MVVLCCFLAPLVQAAGTPPLVLSTENGPVSAVGHIDVFEDASGDMTLHEILRAEMQARFKPSPTEVPNFGVSASAFWGRLAVANGTSTPVTWWLDLADSMVRYSDLFIVRDHGRIDHIPAGSMRAWLEKPVESTTQTFPVTLQASESVELFLRIESEYALLMPLTFWMPSDFNSQRLTSHILHGTFAGIMIAMAIYNLFVFTAVRDKSYLLYVSFLMLVFVNTAGLNGTLAQYLLPASPELVNILFACSYSLLLTSASEFSHAFLGRKTRYTLLARQAAFVISILSLLLYAADIRHVWAVCTIVSGLVCAIGFMGLGIAEILRGNRAARFYSMGFGAFLIASMVFACATASILPINTFTYNAIEIGAALQAIMLSLALAERIRILRVDKEHAERESAHQQTLALQTIRDYSHKLEREVSARTEELIDTQQKLIATEKASALGVFTAGMAHEINNPANFSLVSLQNAETALKRLQHFVNDILEQDADGEIRQAFSHHFEQIDTAIKTAGEGFRRIHSVVVRLQSTVPEGIVGRQPTDLGDLLRSAVTVMTPSLSTTITIDVDIQQPLPVECAVTEMHDVLIAILLNASQAIDEACKANSGLQGRIRISSRMENDQCILCITDNGNGMDAQTLARAFDPFFTTKPVGSGSGLGLSRARSVVTAHGGVLVLDSAPCKGTEVKLSLPVLVRQ